MYVRAAATEVMHACMCVRPGVGTSVCRERGGGDGGQVCESVCLRERV